MTESSFFILQKKELSVLLDEKFEKYQEKLLDNISFRDELAKLKNKLQLSNLTDIDLILKLNNLLDSNSTLLSLIQSELEVNSNQPETTNLQTLQANETETSIKTNDSYEQNDSCQERFEENYDSDYYWKKGDLCYNQNKIDKALSYFEKALEIDPNNPNAINGKGLVLNDKQDYKSAIDLYDKAISIDNQNPDYFYNKGISCESMDDYENAISSFKSAIALNANVDEFHYNLGRLVYKMIQINYKDKKDINQAIKSIDNAIKLNPNVADYYFKKCEILFDIDKNEDALEQIDEAIQLESSKGEYFFKKGQILNEMADYKTDDLRCQAIECFKKAIELGTNNEDYDVATFNSDLGYVYFYLKKFTKALKCFDESLRLDPKNWMAYRGRGVVYNDKGRGDKKDYITAISCYDQAIELAPHEDELYYFKGVSYHKLGTYDDKRNKFLKVDLKKAITCYEQAIKLNPNNAKYHFDMGHSLYCVKEFNLALKAFDSAINLDKTKPVYFKSKGDTLLEMKRYEDARASYKKALHLDSNDSDVKNKLALIKQKIQKMSERASSDEPVKQSCSLFEYEPNESSSEEIGLKRKNTSADLLNDDIKRKTIF